MKTNKKAVLGMLTAIVISLGVMGSINQNKVKKDTSFMQVSLSCGYNANNSENSMGSRVINGSISGMAATAASAFYVAGFTSVGSVVGAPIGAANFLLGGICTL